MYEVKAHVREVHQLIGTRTTSIQRLLVEE
jgi:hypothetical protein